MDIQIKGFIKNSLVDWDGKISCVIFLPKCTFRCPWCYAKDLVVEYESLPSIPFNEVKSYISKYKKFIDGVVVTGGEPTLHNLEELCAELQDLNVLIKLDTNGTNPKKLEYLVKNKMVDYVAMDIKAPLTEEDYKKANGNRNLLKEVTESKDFLLDGDIEYEFRTTVVPTIHTKESIKEIAESIAGAKKWALQPFVIPKEKNKLIDEHFYKVKSFSREELIEFQKIAKEYVENTVLRGV